VQLSQLVLVSVLWCVQPLDPLFLFLSHLRTHLAVAAHLLTNTAPPLLVAVFGAAPPQVLVALLVAVTVARVLAAASLPLAAVVVAPLLVAMAVMLRLAAVLVTLVAVVFAHSAVSSLLCSSIQWWLYLGLLLGNLPATGPCLLGFFFLWWIILYWRFVDNKPRFFVSLSPCLSFWWWIYL